MIESHALTALEKFPGYNPKVIIKIPVRVTYGVPSD
jgi:hypothetical protein